jgi:hypothetical protein
MSVAIRTKRLNETLTPSLSDSGIVPAVAAARSDAEAPERAARHVEAPETSRSRRAEADEGRSGFLSHEFTHGRSQS